MVQIGKMVVVTTSVEGRLEEEEEVWGDGWIGDSKRRRRRNRGTGARKKLGDTIAIRQGLAEDIDMKTLSALMPTATATPTAAMLVAVLLLLKGCGRSGRGRGRRRPRPYHLSSIGVRTNVALRAMVLLVILEHQERILVFLGRSAVLSDTGTNWESIVVPDWREERQVLLFCRGG